MNKWNEAQYGSSETLDIGGIVASVYYKDSKVGYKARWGEWVLKRNFKSREDAKEALLKYVTVKAACILQAAIEAREAE